MDFKDVFIAFGVVIIGVLAIFGVAQSFNNEYGTSIGSTELTNTYNKINTTYKGAFYNFSKDVGNATQTESGAQESGTDSGLVLRSLRIITKLPSLIGIVPSLFKDVGVNILGIPSEIMEMADVIFIGAIAIVFGYLLFIGVRRLFT